MAAGPHPKGPERGGPAGHALAAQCHRPGRGPCLGKVPRPPAHELAGARRARPCCRRDTRP
eukprot:9205551-Alexandrium_andersonii.AAC.1